MTALIPSVDNEIFLRGRLAADVEVRMLPSGDERVAFRLTVARAPTRGPSRVRVDALECAATTAAARRTLLRAAAGDQLEVRGRLHRRFWRTPGGPASRYEVEVDWARITSRRRNAV